MGILGIVSSFNIYRIRPRQQDSWLKSLLIGIRQKVRGANRFGGSLVHNNFVLIVTGIVLLGVVSAEEFAQATPTNLTWTINNISLGYVGSCTQGSDTQTVYNDESGNYSVAEFIAPSQSGSTQGACSFSVPSGVAKLKFLLLGGGGGGGYDAGGGGGGGAYVTGELNTSAGSTFSIQIGTGGQGAHGYILNSDGTQTSSATRAQVVNSFASATCPGNYWGLNGNNGNNSQLSGSGYTIIALGGGGGGGRCDQGTSGTAVGNSGGNGERCFTSYDSSSPYYIPYTPCSTPSAQQNYNNGYSNQNFNSGGINSSYQGGGGGGQAASASSANDSSVSTASGANGVSIFLNSPLNPSNANYGGGGGGGTFCAGNHACGAFAPTTHSSGGGSGGNGGIGDALASAATILHTGGGGGGGGGYSADALKGADGSDGAVFLEWREPLTTSANTVAVNRNATTDGTLSSSGTVALLSAPLSDTSLVASSCGIFSEISTFTLPNNSNQSWAVLDTGTASSTNLIRGFCYMWTQDSTVASSAGVGASPPSDGSGTTFGNLTSPILMLPSRVQINLPSEILVDPRSTSVQFPVISTPTGAGIPQICLMENDGPSLDNSGFGTPAASQNLQFTSGSVNTSQNDSGLTSFSYFWDTETNTAVTLSNMSINLLHSTNFNTPRYLLVRTVPRLYPGFTSDCSSTSPTSSLTPTSRDVFLITIRPYGLIRTIVQQQTDLGHHR